MQAKHLNTKTEVGVRLNINSGCVKLSVPRFWTIGRDSVPLVGAVECALDLHSVPISSCHHRYLTQLKSEPEAKKQTPDQQYPILLFFFALLYFIMNFVPILMKQFLVIASLVYPWTLNMCALQFRHLSSAAAHPAAASH